MIYTCTCVICGRKFDAKRKNAKYCSRDCVREVARRKYHENSEILKSAHPPAQRKPREKPEEKPAVVSIEEISRRAAEAGMSYGKYVLTHREAG